MSDRPEDMQVDLANVVEFDYDVFTIFATDDEPLARQVCEGLEKLNLRCTAQFKHDCFRIGQNVFDNVYCNVSRSNRTLLLLTKKSLDSNWVTLETILALEESCRSNTLRLRVLLHNVAEREIKSFKRGILASVPHISLDFNRNDWNIQLAQEINKVIHLPSLLPAGSMAHGLVFSHYTGFLCHVLPVLEEEIKKSKIFQKKPLHVSRKYYMLLPGTCRIQDDLASFDEELNIEIKKEEILQIVKHHAGKPRTYHITLYRISKGNEEFYFFADFPHVLKAMFRMVNEELAEVDIRFQIARFYYTMNEMINHAENEVCQDTVKLIIFNENVESMQDAIWGAVSNSVPSEVREYVMAEAQIQNLQPNSKGPVEKLLDCQSSCDEAEIYATISCCEDCSDDAGVASEIRKYLEQKGKKVEINHPRMLQLPKAKWHLFVFSKEALQSPTLTMICMSAMVDCLGDNALRVLVVIRDLDPRNIPGFIKSVNMLKVSEPNYCEKLLKTMTGGALRLEHSLPAGDVATGLAWAYVINYLVITLLYLSEPKNGQLDFKGRVQKLLKEKDIRIGCILKMFILLPKSCTTEIDLAAKANKSPNSPEIKPGNGKLSKLGTLDPVVIDSGGQHKRPLFLHMYKHQDQTTQRSICFIAEYCTPANCMREMVENFKFAGLTEEEMGKQCDDFVRILPQIIQSEAVKQKLGDISNLVELICYDDKSESLMSAIERHIEAGNHEIVYAEDKRPTGEQLYHLPN